MPGRTSRGPVSVRRRPWGTIVLAIGGAAVIAALFIALYLPRPGSTPALGADPAQPPTSYVQIDGYDLIVSYTVASGQAGGYFDAPECAACPLNLTPAAVWHLSFSLQNGDLSRAHNVTSFAIGAPFAIESVSPSLPARVAAGGSLSVSLELQLPTTAGYYFVSGTIGAD